MKVKLRVATFNLFSESSKLSLVKRNYIDILFLQQLKPGTINQIAYNLNMAVYLENKTKHTGILYNPQKFVICKTRHVLREKYTDKKVFVASIYLDDVPSVAHYLNHNMSNGDISSESSIEDIIFLCRKNRLPSIRKIVREFEASTVDRAILGGGFNELSHLDYPDLKLPVSNYLEKHDFIDAFRTCYKHDPGHTFPCGGYNKNHPNQRIDYIYVKNIDVMKCTTIETPISDHKIVYSEVFL